MFERFTEKAIKVIMLAQEEARRLGHNFVGTEQILLGLIGEGTGVGAKVLRLASSVGQVGFPTGEKSPLALLVLVFTTVGGAFPLLKLVLAVCLVLPVHMGAAPPSS